MKITGWTRCKSDPNHLISSLICNHNLIGLFVNVKYIDIPVIIIKRDRNCVAGPVYSFGRTIRP
jgi:hypothetical protein